MPDVIKEAVTEHEIVNCEYIGGKLIEVHLRSNPDFDYDNTEFIPVWKNQSVNIPEGYRSIKCPDIHGRIGAYIK